jgi:hypothetical protein
MTNDKWSDAENGEAAKWAIGTIQARSAGKILA